MIGLYLAYTKIHIPTTEPSDPVAAHNPYPVTLHEEGNNSAGRINVVDNGPQAAKKKIDAYMVIQPIASERQIGLVPSSILF